MAAKKPVKPIKKIVLIIVGIIVVIVIALGIFISTFDINKYKPLVEEKVSAAAGYNLKIDGDLGLALFPHLSIEIKGLHLENPEKFKPQAADFVFVEKANVGLALIPLLSKKLEFKDIILNGVKVNLVKPAQGAPNWDLNANKPQTAAAAAAQPTAEEAKKGGDSAAKIAALGNALSFNEISVKNTTIVLHDLAAKKTQTFDNIDFTCGPFNSSNSPVKFSLTARLNNTPLSLKGQIPALAKMLDGPAPFNVEAAYAKLKASAEGTFALAGDTMLDATVKVPSFSPKDAIKDLLPKTPDIIAQSDAKAFNKLETTQKVTVAKGGKITFSGPYTFDETKGELSGGFNKGAITLNLNGDQINLDTYMPKSSGAKASTGKKPILDPSFNKYNVAADVKFNKFVLKGLAFSNGSVNAKLNGGAANAAFSSNYGNAPLKGSFNGNLTAQNGKKTLVFNTSNLPAEPFLQAFTGKGLLAGNVKADLNLSGGGMDIDDFKRSLSGNVDVNIGEGKINLGPAGIPFSTIVAQVPFNSGKGDITKGQMTGDVLEADVTGWVNLANNTMDVTLTPKRGMSVDRLAKLVGLAMPPGVAEAGLSAKIPIRIHGSFSNPGVDWGQALSGILQSVDLKDLKNLGEGGSIGDNIKSNLKEGLKESVEGKAEEKTGESLPDAGDLLKGLFNRDDK